MALTLKEVTRDRVGSKLQVWVGDITFDSSYATGGEALAPADIGFTTIDAVVVNHTAGIVVSHDRANNKLLAYRQKDPANAGGADIALPEVGNTISLATLTVQVIIWGR